MRVCCNAKNAEETQRARRGFADFASEFFENIDGLDACERNFRHGHERLSGLRRDVNAVTGFMLGISSSITPDAANVITGSASAQAVQKTVIDFLLLFMMFFISRVSDHKNATFAKDLHTDGSV